MNEEERMRQGFSLLVILDEYFNTWFQVGYKMMCLLCRGNLPRKYSLGRKAPLKGASVTLSKDNTEDRRRSDLPPGGNCNCQRGETLGIETLFSNKKAISSLTIQQSNSLYQNRVADRIRSQFQRSSMHFILQSIKNAILK